MCRAGDPAPTGAVLRITPVARCRERGCRPATGERATGARDPGAAGTAHEGGRMETATPEAGHAAVGMGCPGLGDLWLFEAVVRLRLETGCSHAFAVAA